MQQGEEEAAVTMMAAAPEEEALKRMAHAALVQRRDKTRHRSDHVNFGMSWKAF